MTRAPALLGFCWSGVRAFPDQQAFALLAEKIVPDTFAQAGEEIRVWVAGCATGEEVYSIAILLYEAAERNKCPLERIKLFATDCGQSGFLNSLSAFLKFKTRIFPDMLFRSFSLFSN